MPRTSPISRVFVLEFEQAIFQVAADFQRVLLDALFVDHFERGEALRHADGLPPKVLKWMRLVITSEISARGSKRRKRGCRCRCPWPW